MSKYYTDEDVIAGTQAYITHYKSERGISGVTYLWEGVEPEVRAVLDAVAPAIAARARQDALREAITAHRDLHRIYGTTATCGGGIGGQMMTQHCGVTCTRGNHDAENAAWEAVEKSYFEGEASR